MMNTRKFISMLTIAGVVLSSCSDDDDNTPEPVSAEEVITTATITLTSDTETISLRFFDADGEDGPTDPVITVSGNLSAETTYTGTIELLNETEDPAELVNEEIEEEADEHQFFYIADELGITSTYEDQECDFNDMECEGSDARPLGINFTLSTTGMTGDAQLRIVLRHLLDKDAEGVSGGDITNAGGDTDIDATFDITVE